MVDDIYNRASFDDLFADIISRVRDRHPGMSEDDAREIEQEIRTQWGGLRVRIAKRLVHDRERIRELIQAGLPERTARRKARGK